MYYPSETRYDTMPYNRLGTSGLKLSAVSLGLKADGTVVAVGRNDYGRCDVSGWENIKLP